jgi:deazaflavin-dependent oxidoreductase (nitroreductase family)
VVRPDSLIARLGRNRVVVAIHRRIVPLDRFLYRATGGRVFITRLLPTLLLVTTGRRTGQARTTPLLYVADGPRYIVAGTNYGQHKAPAWALNLLAAPKATVQLGSRTFPVQARLLSGDEREQAYARLISIWPAYENYRRRITSRDIHVFALEPA